MKFCEGMICLSRSEMELLRDTPWEGHRAFGSTTLLGLVYTESAKTDIKLLDGLASTDVQGLTATELRLAQFGMGDNYISIPDVDRAREMLAEIFADHLVDNPSDVDADLSLRGLDKVVAADALAVLDLA